jgi:hypothetical protein
VDWQRVIAAALQVDDPRAVHIEDVQYADLTGDGVEEAVVSVSSGAAAGVIGYAVYQAGPTGPVRLLAHQEPQLSVRIEGRRLIEESPKAAPNDPLCCPSLLQRVTYGWNGTALAPVSTETVPNPNR